MGHCAQFGSYAIMDIRSRKLLDIQPISVSSECFITIDNHTNSVSSNTLVTITCDLRSPQICGVLISRTLIFRKVLLSGTFYLDTYWCKFAKVKVFISPTRSRAVLATARYNDSTVLLAVDMLIIPSSYFILQKVETAMNSNAMELEGMQRGLQRLKDAGVKIGALVTDRHPSITKVMREQHTDIEHYFDCWHVAKCKCVIKYYFVDGLFPLVMGKIILRTSRNPEETHTSDKVCSAHLGKPRSWP